MKHAIFFALAVLLADSTSSTVVRLHSDDGKRMEIDSVRGVLTVGDNYIVVRKQGGKIIEKEYSILEWIIDGIKRRETK